MTAKHIAAAILLALLAINITACRKEKNTHRGSSYTAKMGGVRHWRGTHYYYASGMHFPTPVNEAWDLPDSTFALEIVNDTAVRYSGTVYSFDRHDTTQQAYFFGMAYYYYVFGSAGGIAYFYNSDSIVYCRGDMHGTSDYWVLKDIYHTY